MVSPLQYYGLLLSVYLSTLRGCHIPVFFFCLIKLFAFDDKLVLLSLLLGR